MRFKVLGIFILLMVFLLLTSCKATKEEDQDKISDLEYTVVEDDNLPDVVAAKIDEVKKEPFKFSYTDGEFIYVAIGYGEQPTGGYSIQINDLFDTNDYIVIRTNLIGPSEEDVKSTIPTYPYAVIKTKDLGLPVCFR